jgi:hypothetical protein
VRRRVVIVPILLLVGALVARRRRRVRAATAPLAAPPRPPVALPEPGVRFVSVPWTPVETDPADPRLTIRYRADERMRLDRVDAQETPTQVFVTVLMRWRPPAGGPVAFAQDHEAVVELSSPVGTRELVHTPVDVEPAGATTDDEPSAPPLYP